MSGSKVTPDVPQTIPGDNAPVAAKDGVVAHHDGNHFGDLGVVVILPQDKTFDHVRGVLGEFVATMLFLFIAIGTVMSQTIDSIGDADALTIAASFGLAIIVLVYCFATVSGGHINPAVSLLLALTKKISLVRFFTYTLAQMAGGTMGVLIVNSYIPESHWDAMNGACNSVRKEFSWAGGLCIEIFTTMILTFAVAVAVDDKQDSHRGDKRQGAVHVASLAPICIGLAVMLAHMISLRVTNTSINPARSFATSIVHDNWDDHEIFWLGPFLASIFTAIVYETMIKDKRVFVEDPDKNF